ncbi:hypothetical protein [Flavobacterium sp.]|uniref:hypothetical protein n=1 Tax=Flavobacterium sp. TaxID=239 RepID=UPI0037513B6D
MVTTNPDKHIRKAVHDLINNIVVSTKVIKSFDSRATNAPLEYVLLTAQTKEIEKSTKCGYRWETSLLIEIYTKSTSSGNTGSRLLLNDIEQAIYTLLNPKITVTGFTNLTQNITFENQLETITDTEIIFRSLLRLNLTLI